MAAEKLTRETPGDVLKAFIKAKGLKSRYDLDATVGWKWGKSQRIITKGQQFTRDDLEGLAKAKLTYMSDTTLLTRGDDWWRRFVRAMEAQGYLQRTDTEISDGEGEAQQVVLDLREYRGRKVLLQILVVVSVILFGRVLMQALVINSPLHFPTAKEYEPQGMGGEPPYYESCKSPSLEAFEIEPSISSESLLRIGAQAISSPCYWRMTLSIDGELVAWSRYPEIVHMWDISQEEPGDHNIEVKVFAPTLMFQMPAVHQKTYTLD